jgi:hypothetical protein
MKNYFEISLLSLAAETDYERVQRVHASVNMRISAYVPFIHNIVVFCSTVASSSGPKALSSISVLASSSLNLCSSNPILSSNYY